MGSSRSPSPASSSANKVPEQTPEDLPEPMPAQAEPISEVSKIKRDRALIDLESGSFEPKTFTTSRKKVDDEAPVVVYTFAFGTAAEKKADEDVTVMNRHHLIEEKLKAEGLCHPNLFPDAQVKDKQWIEYLTNLRKE